MAGAMPMADLRPYLIEALKTDPIDLELLWNIAVWEHSTGQDAAMKDVLQFATRLAPGNAIIAGTLQQETTNGK